MGNCHQVLKPQKPGWAPRCPSCTHLQMVTSPGIDFAVHAEVMCALPGIVEREFSLISGVGEGHPQASDFQ